MKDRTRKTSRVHVSHDPRAGGRRDRDALQLASLIGNGAVQRVARSPRLRRSPVAARFLAGGSATLARLMYEGDEIPEGLGVPTAMEDWLWEQQTMWEDTYRREEELLKYLETRWSRDDELPREEELRRRGVFHPPPVLGH